MTGGGEHPLAAMRRAVTLVEEGRREEARAAIDAAITAAPRSPQLRVMSATARFALRDYQEAIDALDEAVRIAPTEAGPAHALAFELCRRLGWYHEALASMARAIDADPRRAGLHVAAAKLLLLKQRHAAALRHIDAALAIEPASARLSIERANALLSLSRDPEAAIAARAALEMGPADPTLALETARILGETGDFDGAREVLGSLAGGPRGAEASARIGQLDLWAGDLDAAERRAGEALAIDPDLADAHRLRGAARLMRGDRGAALVDLERAIALDPTGYEAYVWRGELRMRRGDRDGAYADVDRGTVLSRGYLLVGRMLLMLTAIRAGEHTRPIRVHQGQSREEMVDGVAGLCADAREIFAGGSPQKIAGLLERALVALAGNRTITPTRALADGRLARLSASETPREAARIALERIAVEPADEVIRALDEVVRDHPDSGLPRTHRGELYLWLGRYAEAREDLERVIADFPRTRWAYIGLTTLEVIGNNPAAALEISALGVTRMNDTTGPAVYGARGEALRALGRIDAARKDLATAVDVNPTRISAWLNLGLAHGEAGDAASQAAVLERLKEQAAALLSDASLEIGVRLWDGATLSPDAVHAVLARALEMLRGNRSSGCVTYFPRSGRLRVVLQGAGARASIHQQDENDLARLRARLTPRPQSGVERRAR